MDRSKVIILVTGTTIEPHDANWKECLRTWVPELRNLGYNVMISIGDKYLETNYKIDGDIIWFKAEDNKYGLFDKSIKLPIRWILKETDYEYYFRIDSDSFVEPKRFDEMMVSNFTDIPHLDYMGCCHPYMGWDCFKFIRCFVLKEKHIVSGCGYLVSRRAMEVANRTMRVKNINDLTIDDWVLGRAMWENGIPILHDSRVLFESNHKKLTEGTHKRPDIADPKCHLAIQHYMNGHMEEAMVNLGYRN